jgi:group I intron endonuclease
MDEWWNKVKKGALAASARTGKDVLVEACEASESDEESEGSDDESEEESEAEVDGCGPREGFGADAAELTRRNLDQPFRHHRNAVDENESEAEERSANQGPVEEGSGGQQGAVLTRPSAICPHSPAKHKKDKGVGLIYKWTNTVNGKGYVGKDGQGGRRYWEHATGKSMRGKKKHKRQLIDMKIQEYGIDAFKYEVLEDNIPRAELLDTEAKWMRSENTRVPNGYNILPPGVEVVSMSDPVIRARWEAANPEGSRKATATKRAKREAKLAKMDPEVADALRERLDKEAARNGKRHRGEEMEPDGRFGRNEKRRATWKDKQEAKLATMNEVEAKRYRQQIESGREQRERKADELRRKNQQPEHVAWMKEYRKANKHKRVVLGKQRTEMAETIG